jgi:hypothetical protein
MGALMTDPSFLRWVPDREPVGRVVLRTLPAAARH